MFVYVGIFKTKSKSLSVMKEGDSCRYGDGDGSKKKKKKKRDLPFRDRRTEMTGAFIKKIGWCMASIFISIYLLFSVTY